MGIFYLKFRDTAPSIDVYLKNPDGTAFDLAGSTTWKLHVNLRGSATVVSRDMTKIGPDVDGHLRYAWLATDWTSALVVGRHRVEYEVVGAGGARLTFPNDGYDELWILEDLGQG